MGEELEKPAANRASAAASGWIEAGWTAFKLGLTSFGGPVAHIGYCRETYVRRKRWLDESEFADLTAMCQFLPGPASSQLGMAIGMRRAGVLGGIAAWAGFTLPSAVLMTAFAYGFHAIVVGLLAAALYDPVCISAVHHAADAAAATAAFAALLSRIIPPLAVVAACAAAGWLIGP